MNMVVNETLMKFGFIKDENNSQFKEIFKNNLKIKEIHIDIYPNNPMLSSTEFMLLLRTSENNATILNDGNRLILKKNDQCETYFMNILFSNIKECFLNMAESCNEFIVNVQNLYYKITVFN